MRGGSGVWPGTIPLLFQQITDLGQQPVVERSQGGSREGLDSGRNGRADFLPGGKRLGRDHQREAGGEADERETGAAHAVEDGPGDLRLQGK